MGLNTIVIGDGDKVVGQYPTAGSAVITGDKVFLLTNGSKIMVPNLTNWSRIEVIKFCELAKIDYKINGYGYVIKQNIKAETELNGQIIEVDLQNKEHKKEKAKDEKKTS